jgi:large subunit ribosomal protein L29
MKAKDLRDMPNHELLEHIATARKDLFGVRFANATGELDDTASIRRNKRELARALTIAHERDLPTDGAVHSGTATA